MFSSSSSALVLAAACGLVLSTSVASAAATAASDPITCQGNECGACVDANIPIVGDQSICVNFTITGSNDDPDIDLSINLDGKPIYDKNVDIGDLEKGLCLSLPGPLKALSACVKFENVTLDNGDLHACADVAFEAGGKVVKDFQLDCFDVKIPTAFHPFFADVIENHMSIAERMVKSVLNPALSGDSPFKCQGDSCAACGDENIQGIGDESMCVNFTFSHIADSDPSVDIIVGPTKGTPFIHETVDLSAMKSGVCHSIGSSGYMKKVQICVVFTKTKYSNGNLHTCPVFQAKLGSLVLKSYSDIPCVDYTMPQ